MTAKETTWIALIRAIGPATHKKMSMAQLRESCKAAGFKNIRTVLATGNIIFSSNLPELEIHRILSTIIAGYELLNEVFLRRPDHLRQVLSENPFSQASLNRPNHMLVLFLSTIPGPSQISAFESFDGRENIKVIGKEAYIDYADGVARSKLTPNRIEKLLGNSGTARNWNTIRKFIEKT